GYYVTAYYDNAGELTYYEITSGGGLQYGYIIAAATGGSALDSSTKVKILGTDGKINIYTSGNKFILDGVSVSAGNTTYTVNTSDDVDLKRRQVVRYRAQEDVLREIDTVIIRSGKEDASITLDEALVFDTSAEGNSKYKIRSGSIDRKYAFSSDCIMFIDEADIGDTNPDNKMFSVQNVGNIGSSEYYMAGYDANNDNEISCIVRYDGYGASSGEGSEGLDYWSTYCRVVESVKRAMNDEGTLGWNLVLAGDSKQETYFVPEDMVKLYSAQSADDWGSDSLTVHKEDVSDFTNIVKSGDIIRFRTNMDGNINYIEKMFDFEDHKDIISEVPDQGGQIYGFAYLEKTRGDYLVYSYGDADERYISSKCEKYDIVPLYHVSTGKVEMIPFEQLPAASSGNTVKCFIRYYNYGNVYDNIFYMYD
ncbi:MAG: hypothetical protein IJ454_04395, partial [Clostridia bacterium]|nr:hypothetical protein [Clostridia bacterium]